MSYADDAERLNALRFKLWAVLRCADDVRDAMAAVGMVMSDVIQCLPPEDRASEARSWVRIFLETVLADLKADVGDGEPRN